ncbi:MAG: type I restriction-modification system endonuclease [Eubacterium sp.]|nr:type I restriction-modification system endonuclease [Eubacterium sp.]
MSEKYVYSDPNTSVIKQGMLAEVMVKYMLAYDGIKEPDYDNTHANRIRLLKRNDLLPHEIDNTLYILRKDRNNAAHNGADEGEKALNNLPLLYELCVWYMQTYGDYSYNPAGYVQPVDITISLDELEKENRELEERNKTLLVELQRIQKAGKSDNTRRAIAYKNAVNVKLSEAQTRELIDEQLRKAGWDADTDEIRYSKGVRPVKGKNLAIAEWPTDSRTGNGGFADYALFIGEKMVGIIEAKKKHTNVSSVLDGQCKEYAKMIKAEHEKYIIKQYGNYKVPFLFATNGRDYIKQYEEMSGIWFLDTRQQFNTSKALAGWPSPQGIEQDLERDIEEADRKLAVTGYELLQDSNGLGLRYYQVEAVKAAEKAIAEHKNTVLLAMATGTGKTRTVLGMIYRFLSAKRFKRILYLVDRTALGDQTMDTFKEVKLEDLKTLNQLYDIKDLGEKEYEKDTRVHIATVQSLVKRILYNESDVSIGVSDYDCIIVDEAHRGYILDKEMGENEVLYRNQDDFRSKYRAVIDYFDAVKIALTATPALHTTEIFGKPVYSYDYRTAVVDGYLVDHDAPHIIRTKLSEEGIVFEAGSTAPIYDSVTNTVTNSDELEDDLKFEVEDFNRKVVTEGFNKAVLTEIARDIDPNEKGKTLIFAVDDAHADMVTRILKNYYSEQGISEEAVMKITGSIENGNPVKIKEAIRRFKNEIYPNIVVTVDLLTTGIDVEEIVNLVFLRRIRSRILFEQMLGRATRLCPEIGKTHFEIYDAVGVYQALDPVSTMKPVVVSQTATFDDLIDGIDHLESDKAKRNQLDIIIAKILRNKNKMTDRFREQFKSLSNGESPESFADALRNMTIDKAVETVKKSRAAFAYVRGVHQGRKKFISDAQDEVTSHERGYGNATRPEDYLKEFHTFIDNNINEIAALNIVATRPKELTRQSLRELKLILDRNNFSETKLQTAWKQMTNEDIAADIISFIRQKSIGDALVTKEERIHAAIVKTKAAHPELSRVQLNWLERIEAYLLKEVVLNKESFEAPQFKIKGGYTAIDKAFGNKLDAVIDEINSYMYIV